MKKMNAKGFTLIELLAVITIMGILMIVAIPSVTRTIENSRKDTFIDTVKQYVNGVKTMWASDNLSCGSYVSSAVPTGFYYVEINSSSTSVPQVLESGGKSSWGNRDIKGYVLIHVYDTYAPGKDGVLDADHGGDAGVDANDDVTTRKVDYYPRMADGIHGVNIYCNHPEDGLKLSENLKRGDLVMSGVTYDMVRWTTPEGSTSDIMSSIPTGWEDITDNAYDEVAATKCVEV